MVFLSFGFVISGDDKISIALFHSEGFPFIDTPPLKKEDLEMALKGYKYKILSTPEDINKRLNRNGFDLLILPYGSAFPLQAWNGIRHFLKDGGNLLVLGGAPFHQPVWKEKNGKKWKYT